MRNNTKAKNKPNTTTKAPKATKPAITTEAPAATTEAPKPIRALHTFAASYAGVSSTLNRSKSRTRIAIELFNTQAGLIFTARQNAFMHDLLINNGDTPFKRLNLDAGNLNRAVRAGHVQHVSGDPASELCEFQLTKLALNSKFN